MSLAVLAIFAAIPIVAALVLMVGLRMGAMKAMPIAWLACAVIGIMVWKLPGSYVAALSIQGVISAFGILIIVFGALLILHTLQYSGGMETIQYGMANITKDMRVQAIIVGYMFGAFVEGAAGFGTPAALAAPLLFALGFPPMAAAVICLCFNSFPVSFGGAGIPIIVGIGPALKSVGDALVAAGTVGSFDAFLKLIGETVSLMHAPMALILPVFMLGFITRFFGPNRSWSEGLAAWKFCIFAGLSFVVPYLLLAWLVGPEPPTLVSALIGLGVIFYGAKHGICMPTDKVWTFGDHEKWDPAWTGTIAFSGSKEFKSHMSQTLAWLPYVLVGGILVITRLEFLPIKAWLNNNAVLSFTGILGYSNVNESLKILYLPGTIPFILIALCVVFMHRMSGDKVAKAWRDTAMKIWPAAIALCASVALVKIFQGSGVNPELAAQVAAGTAKNLPSMPLAMATTMGNIFGDAWPFLASYTGGLGAFITGSNTVSNLLFGMFQWDIAGQLGFSRIIVTASQVAGGAMGNMVCIHNIIACCSVVGLLNREGEVLRKTFWPFVLYGIVVGIVTYILIGMNYSSNL
ncbi:MAG: L-lactate permease [Desulfovibrio sp.]|jgi:lactate permease|nr:L-lactate permease [Desulfovibrio sp.]